MPQVQPIRTIVKGAGAWVDEVYTNPETKAVINVNSYTKEKLEAMLAQIDARVAPEKKRITDMLALLS